MTLYLARLMAGFCLMRSQYHGVAFFIFATWGTSTMSAYPCPINFAVAWHDCTEQDPQHRGAAALDLAFWREHAAGYDEHSLLPGSYEETLAAIQRLVRPEDTLLDVGVGTGRFAIPLAAHVQRVTALDHAAPMLDLLRTKVRQQAISNIDLIEMAWEEADVLAHDVVLAAWSLYRLPNLLYVMHKLIAATQRTLVIVAGAGHSLRHDPLLASIWSHMDEDNTPLHIYFYGVLWQAGVHADLQIVHEHRPIVGPTPDDIAKQLAPADAQPDEVATLALALSPLLTEAQGQLCDQQSVPVALLIWYRRPLSST